MKPGESKDDIFLAAIHDIEEMLLSDFFNIRVEGAGVANCTSFVCSLVHIVNCNGGGKFFDGEVVFSDKLPADTGDISIGVY